MKANVTSERLEEAYILLAQIVRTYGDKYLPLFKRLHEETEQRKADRDLSAIAVRIAKTRPK